MPEKERIGLFIILIIPFLSIGAMFAGRFVKDFFNNIDLSRGELNIQVPTATDSYLEGARKSVGTAKEVQSQLGELIDLLNNPNATSLLEIAPTSTFEEVSTSTEE